MDSKGPRRSHNPNRPGLHQTQGSSTPRPAPTSRQLVIHGGFAAIDQPQRRLHDHARALGFTDLGSDLQARWQQQASPAQLASELNTTTKVVGRLLERAGINPPPRQVSAARRRRTTTDHRLSARVAELGFASLRAYLADRAVTRQWPSTSIACELGVHTATVCDRLDQHRLPRRRATVRPQRAIPRQTACWVAKRQARLAGLGFGDVKEYLRVRRVEQGWSLRRMLAELQVGSAWLKDQMKQLQIP